MTNRKGPTQFDKQANLYETSGYLKILAQKRKRLIASASGEVLEVGVGVGANFPYYTDQVGHVTAMDISSEMVKRAKDRAFNYNVQASFIQTDIADLAFKPNQFDTIVSTLTVCGYADPIATLKNFRTWCREDGIILFLEHGLSRSRALAQFQKIIDPVFKKVTGCHCDRDIIQLIEQAELKIIRKESFWSDIVSLIWAKPSK